METSDLRMKPIENNSVVQQVITRITDMLQAGRFKPGDRLPTEYQLMDELHVSRNSLREAIKILSAMGLLVVRRGDGTYICDELEPSVFDSVAYSILMGSSRESEIVELRQLLDENVLRLAIRNCRDDEIDLLQESIDEMRRLFEEGLISAAARVDYNFHLRLAHYARNRFLERIVIGVYRLFENSIEKNIRTEDLFAQAAEHHQNIVDCLRARDQGQVRDIVERSLSSWKKDIKEKMQ